MSTVGKYSSHRKESYSEKARVSFERKFHRSEIQSNLTSLLRQRPRVPLSTLSVDHSPPHRFILNGGRRGESPKLYSGRILLSPTSNPFPDTTHGTVRSRATESFMCHSLQPPIHRLPLLLQSSTQS